MSEKELTAYTLGWNSALDTAIAMMRDLLAMKGGDGGGMGVSHPAP